ncbi:RadC family protein [Floccifex sp.]|uniref:RadC family protein n=1 Tax=Floccifex sp. TaxID=2815810 RepID=UPI002A765198|nr:DNA repair protein RadC [Floccifex sp.]MDD7281730.1 DNA repair protein RadC [Erysipelotrichaceae bacterium]MDY2957588.1 DNA repair protein RadC [Floccifex sp.]
MKVKEMNIEQRPREKALRFGLESLTDLELIALILQSGNKKRDVFEIAKDVLKKSEDLNKMYELSAQSLMEIQGISKVKSLQLLAGIELSKRALRTNAYHKTIRQAQDVIDWFKMEYGTLKQENFVVLYLDVKQRLICHSNLFKGTLSESTVHPRDIFRKAFELSAYSVMVMHNHPSNDPTPSQNDIYLTQKLNEIAHTMGIIFLDHVIVGKNTYFSFREQGYLH